MTETEIKFKLYLYEKLKEYQSDLILDDIIIITNKEKDDKFNKQVINLFHRMFNISEDATKEYQKRTSVDIKKLTLRDSTDEVFLKKLKDFEKRLKLEKLINNSKNK
jgi:hypothetical protein